MLCNLSPSVTESLVELDNLSVFLLGEACLDDVGGEVIMPAFTALLADTVAQLASDESPALGTVLFQ
jgi:hypothetical protein